MQLYSHSGIIPRPADAPRWQLNRLAPGFPMDKHHARNQKSAVLLSCSPKLWSNHSMNAPQSGDQRGQCGGPLDQDNEWRVSWIYPLLEFSMMFDYYCQITTLDLTHFATLCGKPCHTFSRIHKDTQRTKRINNRRISPQNKKGGGMKSTSLAKKNAT